MLQKRPKQRKEGRNATAREMMIVILNRKVRTSSLRSEFLQKSMGDIHADTWGESYLSRGNDNCKDPALGVCLVCLRS